MNLTLLLLMTSLAAYRLWRFLAKDTLPIVAAPRQRLAERAERKYGAGWAEGIGCAWCGGVWVSVVVVSAVWLFHPLPLPGLWYLAVACAVGLIGGLDG